MTIISIYSLWNYKWEIISTENCNYSKNLILAGVISRVTSGQWDYYLGETRRKKRGFEKFAIRTFHEATRERAPPNHWPGAKTNYNGHYVDAKGAATWTQPSSIYLLVCLRRWSGLSLSSSRRDEQNKEQNYRTICFRRILRREYWTFEEYKILEIRIISS